MSHGATPDQVDKIGDTALNKLCDGVDSFGTIPILHLLLSNDTGRAQLDRRNRNGHTALMKACENDLLSVVEVLLEQYSANVHVQCHIGTNAAFIAVSNCNMDILELLIRYGVDVNMLFSFFYEYLLIWACFIGEEEAVAFLLGHGANVNVRLSRADETPLIMAVRGGYFKIVTLLLLHDADINAMDKNGRSALFLACKYGHEDIARMLMSFKPDLDLFAIGNVGGTALIGACRRGDALLVRLLQQQGADLDVCDDTGRPALMYAVNMGYSKIVEFLLDKGCAVYQHYAHSICEV